MAFQQGAIVAEEKVICSANRDAQPSTLREPIVNRLYVGHDLHALRVHFAAVVAHQEHERLMKAFLNNAAEGLTVHIDGCLAAGIVVAKLRCGGPAEGVTEYSDSGH